MLAPPNSDRSFSHIFSEFKAIVTRHAILCGSCGRGMLTEIPTPLVLSAVAGYHSLRLQRMCRLNGCSRLLRRLFSHSGMEETGEDYNQDLPTPPTRIGYSFLSPLIHGSSMIPTQVRNHAASLCFQAVLNARKV